AFTLFATELSAAFESTGNTPIPKPTGSSESCRRNCLLLGRFMGGDWIEGVGIFSMAILLGQ
ncbi:MAG: hypothetical protein ACI80L_001089, partial [Pseudohongiellaceae bacterium]